MKTNIKAVLIALFIAVGNMAMAQYDGCPHGLSAAGSQVGYLSWRFIDPATGQTVTTVAPNPYADKVYRMDIFQTGAPANTRYASIGIQGSADGFKMYSSQNDANNDTNAFTEDQVNSGLAKDVGASQTATWYIRTLPSSDPNWSGQLTAFKAFGNCYPSTIGYPNKYYKKTLIFRN